MQEIEMKGIALQETELLLPKPTKAGVDEHAHDEIIEHARNKKGWRDVKVATVESFQSSGIGIIMLGVACFVLAFTSLPHPFGEDSSPNDKKLFKEKSTHVLTLDQKLDIWDHWKNLHSWENILEKDLEQREFWDSETFRRHTRMWVSETEEKGEEWWHEACDFFRDLSDELSTRLLKDGDNEEEAELQHNSQMAISGRRIKRATGKHEPLIFFNHTDAFKLILSQGDQNPFEYASDFFYLQQGWDAQINQAYCGVATSMAILNSLRGIIDLEVDPVYKPYPYATQSDAFNECTDANVIKHNDTFDGVLSAPFGLTLDASKALLECHLLASSWVVDAYHVDPTVFSQSRMRSVLKDALKDPNCRVLINYDRRSAGQIGGGHFSPLAGYSTARDSFLIMDVAKYKYPPVWISSERLYHSLSSIDNCGVWDGPIAQLRLPPNLLHPKSMQEMAGALNALHCQQAYRGFIIVSKR